MAMREVDLAIQWMSIVGGATAAYETANKLAQLWSKRADLVENAGSVKANPLEALGAQVAAIEAHDQQQDDVVRDLAVQLRDIAEATEAVDRRVRTATIVAAVAAALAVIAVVVALL